MLRFSLYQTFGALTGVSIGLGIWAGSTYGLGVAEPWDAPTYYLSSLLIAGIAAGTIFCRGYVAYYLGMLLAQCIALLFFTERGPFGPLGIFSIIIFSLVTLFTAIITEKVRQWLCEH